MFRRRLIGFELESTKLQPGGLTTVLDQDQHLELSSDLGSPSKTENYRFNKLTSGWCLVDFEWMPIWMIQLSAQVKSMVTNQRSIIIWLNSVAFRRDDREDNRLI